MQACMAPPEYDAVQIRKKYSLRPLAVTSRTIQIVGLLGSFGFEVRHPPMHVYARAPMPPTVRCVSPLCVVRSHTATNPDYDVLGGLCVGQVLGDKLTGQLDKKMSARAVQFRTRLTSLGPTFIKVRRKTPLSRLVYRGALCPHTRLTQKRATSVWESAGGAGAIDQARPAAADLPRRADRATGRAALLQQRGACALSQ